MENEKKTNMSKKEANKYMRFLIKEWTEAGTEKKRIDAFVTLRKLVSQNSFLMEQTMKCIYLAFVKCCKQYTEQTHQSIIVMRNCVTELYSMDTVTAYQHAFVYIRQLAIHVRNAMTSMTEVDIHSVYNWQFINCLRLWTYMVIQPSLQQAFQPLVYPLIQVIDSTINLIPTARYYPLRLHCIDLYNQLISATGIYIPVAPLLLDVIENEKFLEKPTASEKAPDISYSLKLSKLYLASRSVQDAIVTRSIALLSDYLHLFDHSVAFPELAYPISRSLKNYSKKCKVVQWSMATKTLSQKLDKQVENMIRSRENLTGAPFEMKDQGAKKVDMKKEEVKVEEEKEEEMKVEEEKMEVKVEETKKQQQPKQVKPMKKQAKKQNKKERKEKTEKKKM